MLGSPVTDTALVRRLLDGDQDAFDTFFDGMFPRLYRFALPRVDHREDAAEDAAQATICLAIRKLATYRGEASLFTWLCTLCRREIATQRERQRRRQPVELLEDVPEIRSALESLHARVGDAPHASAERHEVVALVQRVLDHLPTHYGRALEWKYIDELSVREIAGRLGLGEKATESMLTRARRAFRDVFASLSTALAPAPSGARGDSE